MKFLPLFLGLFLLFIATGFSQSVQQLASEGQRAYLAGDVATAKAKFEQVIGIDPKNPVATGYLRTIKAQEAKAGPGGGLEQKLQALVLPEVKFKDATLAAALEYLKQMAAKQSVAVSFVVQADVDREVKVTLNLSSVPFLEAVRYVCSLSNTTFMVDRFAVVVKKG